MTDPAVAHLRAWLRELGLDGDPEMAQTAELVTELFRERGAAPAPELACCATAATTPIALRDMPFYGLCAHHLLPFFGTAAVVYRPGAKLAGLGSVPRLLQHLALRPQIQERLAEELVEGLADALEPVGVAVALEARHMCVEMRGARSRLLARVVATRGIVDDELVRELDAARS